MPQDPCKCDPDIVEIAKRARCAWVEQIKTDYNNSVAGGADPDEVARAFTGPPGGGYIGVLNALDEFLARCG